MTRKLPREYALEGYLLMEGAYDPQAGDHVDFYSPASGDKLYGPVVRRTSKLIVMRDSASGDIFEMKIAHR